METIILYAFKQLNGFFFIVSSIILIFLYFNKDDLKLLIKTHLIFIEVKNLNNFKKYEKSISLITTFLKKYGFYTTNFKLQKLLADTYFLNKDFKNAIKSYNDILNSYHFNSKYNIEYATIPNTIALAYFEQKKYVEALRVIRDAVLNDIKGSKSLEKIIYEEYKKQIHVNKINNNEFVTNKNVLDKNKDNCDKKDVVKLPKRISYKPNNTFFKDNFYPVVLMPKENSIIKYPKKGKSSRKGFKEDSFCIFLNSYFKDDFTVLNDRHLILKNSTSAYEPDFVIYNESNNNNIFINIEIDEPYEGINDISKRKPTHSIGVDDKRNIFFTDRGWIVIRFAEIQIENQPVKCCSFIAKVINCIDPSYKIPDNLKNFSNLIFEKTWNDNIALKWSKEKYREKYLGIYQFGTYKVEESFIELKENKTDMEVEKLVEESPVVLQKNQSVSSLADILIMSYKVGQIVKILDYSKKLFLLKISYIDNNSINGYCYLNCNKTSIPKSSIKSLKVLENYYSNKITEMNNIFNYIQNNLKGHNKIYLRIKYKKPDWYSYYSDEFFSGELTTRTISNINPALSVLNQQQIEQYNLTSDHLTAYCYLRNEERTFKIERIKELEVLNI